MADLPKGLSKLARYSDGFVEAFNAIEESKNPPEGMEGVLLETFKRRCRNVAVATSGLKAELMGTLTTPPTLQMSDLTALGLNNKKAAEIISERDRIRTEALALIQ